MGIERWYEHYELRVARVERSYSGPGDGLHPTAWDAAGPPWAEPPSGSRQILF
jgi:hypothetical protein